MPADASGARPTPRPARQDADYLLRPAIIGSMRAELLDVRESWSAISRPQLIQSIAASFTRNPFHPEGAAAAAGTWHAPLRLARLPRRHCRRRRPVQR